MTNFYAGMAIGSALTAGATWALWFGRGALAGRFGRTSTTSAEEGK